MSTFLVRGINCFTFHLKFRKQNKTKKNSQKHISFYTQATTKRQVRKEEIQSIPLDEDKVQVGVQLQGALPPPPSGVYLRSELWAELPWDPATSSTARRWAPTEAPCPACRSAGAARRKPGRDPGWRWWRRRSGRSCAPSRGPFPPLSSAPRAVVEEEEKKKRRFKTQRF